MHLSDVAAVLLDMDGTLVDSDAAVGRAWTAWAGEYGVKPEAALSICHGHPTASTVAVLFPDLDRDAAAAAAARQLELQYDDLSDVTAAVGARSFLALLGELGIPWAVVTSADQRLAKARLGAAGIAPPVLVTSDDVTVGKPDPAGYLLAAKLLRVAPERCLVVEDAEPGVAAGRAAGVGLVAALKGVPGDLQIEDFSQLSRLLRGGGCHTDVG